MFFIKELSKQYLGVGWDFLIFNVNVANLFLTLPPWAIRYIFTTKNLARLTKLAPSPGFSAEL